MNSTLVVNQVETVTVEPLGIRHELTISHTSDGGAMVTIGHASWVGGGEVVRVSPARTCGETECGYRMVKGARQFRNASPRNRLRYDAAPSVACAVRSYIFGKLWA